MPQSRAVAVCLSLGLLLTLATCQSDAASFRVDGVEPEAGFTYPYQFPPDAFCFRISHFPPQLQTFTAAVEVTHQGKSVWSSPPIDAQRPMHGDSALVAAPIPAGVSFVGGLEYSWIVRVYDTQGKRLTQSPRMSFRVENKAPLVHMRFAPADGGDPLDLRQGDVLSFMADVHDDEDEQLGFQTELVWWVTEPEAKSAVQVGSGPVLQYGFFSAGTYLLEVKATDKFGEVGSAQRQIVVGAGSICASPSQTWGSVMVVEPLGPCLCPEDGLPRQKISAEIVSGAGGEELVVLFSSIPEFFYVGDTLDMVAQFDPEANEAAYELRWYADGVEVGYGSRYTHRLISEGDTEITLEVVDPRGERASDTAYLVAIRDRQPPQITITSPVDGTRILPGSRVHLGAEAEDPEGPDRVLPLRWFVNGVPLIPGDASVVLQEEGAHLITVSGQDRAGNYGGASVRVDASASLKTHDEPSVRSSVRVAGLDVPAVALAGYLYDLAAVIEASIEASEERIFVTWLLDGAPVDAAVLTGPGGVGSQLCFPHAGHFRLAVRAEDDLGFFDEQAVQVLVVNSAGPTIVWPASRSGSTQLLGNPVLFEAINLPADGQYEWVSDVDGLLAEGEAACEAELSPGRHEIALWVGDFVTTVEIIVDDAPQLLASRSLPIPPCTDGVEADASTLTIRHEPISEALGHTPLVVRAEAGGESPVCSVNLFFRPEGTLAYYRLPMARFPDEYRGIIPPSYMIPGGIEYFIEAVDSQCQVVSYPEMDAIRKPLHIKVTQGPVIPQEGSLAPPRWQGSFEMGSRVGQRWSASLDVGGEWGPLGLRVHLDSDDPMYGHQRSQPGHEYEVSYEARLLELGLGALSSHVAPLGLDATYHRGTDVTAGLGPLSLQMVQGRLAYEVPGQTCARELVALRPAFFTQPLEFSLNIVKIRDGEQAMVGPDPEVNYVIDGQAGVGMFGRRLALETEIALSVYHDNARGDLWTVIDTYRGDPDLGGPSQDVLRLLDKIPSGARSFFQLPDPQYGVPLVDIGGEVELRLPLPWSEIKVEGYRFGRDYHTIAGRGDTDAEGYRATFSTVRLFDAVHLKLDYENRADGVASLVDFMRNEAIDERTNYASYGAQLSLGRTGRPNLDFRGRLTEEKPLGGVEPTKRVASYTLQVRNLTRCLGSIDLHFAIGAGLERLDILTGNDGGVGTLINPRLTGSLGLSAWHPRFGSFTAQGFRAHCVVAVEQSRDIAGQVVSWASTCSVTAETQLTPSTTLGASCRGRYERARPSEVSASGFFRWRF